LYGDRAGIVENPSWESRKPTIEGTIYYGVDFVSKDKFCVRTWLKAIAQKVAASARPALCISIGG